MQFICQVCKEMWKPGHPHPLPDIPGIDKPLLCLNGELNDGHGHGMDDECLAKDEDDL